MSAQNSRQLLPLYLACYILWLGLAALGVWLMFAARSALIGLAFFLRFNPWVLRAVDDFGFVTLGLLWLAGVLLLEHVLRQGVLKSRLWKRAAYAFVLEAAALAFCYGLRLFLS
jgi:hypothetical protein